MTYYITYKVTAIFCFIVEPGCTIITVLYHVRLNIIIKFPKRMFHPLSSNGGDMSDLQQVYLKVLRRRIFILTTPCL